MEGRKESPSERSALNALGLGFRAAAGQDEQAMDDRGAVTAGNSGQARDDAPELCPHRRRYVN
jgi:hypothetical protein